MNQKYSKNKEHFFKQSKTIWCAEYFQAGGLEYLVQQLFLSVDDVTSGPEVAAVARVIKKSAIALSRQGNRVLKKFKAHTFYVLSFCCQNSDLCQQPQQPCVAGCARVPASAWRWRTRGAWPGWSSSARSPDSGTDRGPQAQV